MVSSNSITHYISHSTNITVLRYIFRPSVGEKWPLGFVKVWPCVSGKTKGMHPNLINEYGQETLGSRPFGDVVFVAIAGK